MTEVCLILGDCLDRLSEIPEGSVDAVICDPPYGTVKGAALDGWGGTKTDWDVVLRPADFLDHCNRILRVNGGLVLFGQEPYTSRLITEAHGNIPFSYRMVWEKNHFANPLISKKSPVFYHEDILVFHKKYDTLAQHPLREYSRKVLEHCGGSLKELNSRLGHRRAEHFFYVRSTQFGLCTKETYGELCCAYGIDEQPWFMSYEDLAEINDRFRRRFRRRFNLPDGKMFKSSILKYKKDQRGFHPTQKPIDLMEDLIRTYTNAGDTVLDFTMGSGSTGVACVKTGRRFIGIERDPDYFAIAERRIADTQPMLMAAE